ncbi:MAG: response regulator [Candidatus Thiodiazotropha sp.]
MKQQDPDGMAEQALTSFSHHTGDKPVVLIADDSRVVRVSLKNILKDDCQIIEAENGQEAWDLLCDTPSVTLVFSDLSMPKLDGRALLTKVRSSESPALAKIPFIVVTGNEESQEIRQELDQMGANEIICKPFDADNIKEYVQRFGETQRAQQETSSKENETAQQEFEPQSDYLEGIADKQQFMVSASRELAFAIRNKNELAIALVRIDQIDEISEHYSDPAIDHILRSLAEIINLHIHPDDTLAYFGRGLFAMLRPASNAIGTRYLGRRILEDLATKQFYLGESEQIISASIAISAPDIKPGTRLIELLNLAQGRLNTAMENGGNKVVDKGNESPNHVNLVSDTSELTSQSANNTTASQTSPTRSATEIHRLAAEQVAQIKAKYGNDAIDQDDPDSELIEHQQTIERLTNENRQLINEIAHWKRQSAESDNLRRRLFELESQLQQMQVKFSELQIENHEFLQKAEASEDNSKDLLQRIEVLKSENNLLIQRSETAESTNSGLLQRIEAVENEKSSFLQQAETAESVNKELLGRLETIESLNQALVMEQESRSGSDNSNQLFFEEENKRLESQIAELKGRTEKAESENIKSNQLVHSLEDNIKLLHMQLDQLQQELAEEKQKKIHIASKEKRVDTESSGLDSNSQTQTDSASVSNTQNSDLLLNPLPDTIANRVESEPPSVHLFPDQDQVKSKQQLKTKATIPPFRVEAEPLIFKNGFHLSSFTIASIILIAMLIAGTAYLFTIFSEEPKSGVNAAEVTSEQSQDQGSIQTQTKSHKTSTPVGQAVVVNRAEINKSNKVDKTPEATIADEIRLEKELTLRRIAEEEFRIKSQQALINHSQTSNFMQNPQPTSDDSE